MSNFLIKKDRPQLTTNSLRDRVTKPVTGIALLLDVSGSMGDCVNGDYYNGNGERRIEALRKIVNDLPIMPTFAFDTSFEECHDRVIPEPRGGTALARAFFKVKELGYKRVIVITDGAPDSTSAALDAARAFNEVTAIYVGPDPMPQFMTDLLKFAKGSVTKESLDASGQKAIADKIKGLLK